MKAKPGRKPKKRWWTVLLMRPDYVADLFYDRSEMYLEHAFAVTPLDAVTIVRRKAVKADNEDDGMDADDIGEAGIDYAPLLVLKGRQQDYSLWID